MKIRIFAVVFILCFSLVATSGERTTQCDQLICKKCASAKQLAEDPASKYDAVLEQMPIARMLFWEI
jgi:hypothetical protein